MLDDGDDRAELDQEDDDQSANGESGVTPRVRPSLDGLSLAGLTRRRVAGLVGALLTAWIVIVFARQVGEASTKAAEADQSRLGNTTLSSEIASLQRELALVQRQAFIEQQAHGLGLGGSREHAFALAAGAPALGPNAPGSAAVRLGATPAERSPLDTWLSMLFGPAPTDQ